MASALANVVPSHLQDRNLYPFRELQATGRPDPSGDKAFDDEDEACAPATGATASVAAPVRWTVPD